MGPEYDRTYVCAVQGCWCSVRVKTDTNAPKGTNSGTSKCKVVINAALSEQKFKCRYSFS